MSISPEKLKELITEEEAALIIKKKKFHEVFNRLEQTKYDKLHQRLIDDEGLDRLPSIEELQKLYLQIKPYEAQSTSDAVIAMIFKDFAQKFGEENIKNTALHFPDDPKNEKANEFFKGQATKGHAFLFKQRDCDNYAFSDGNGHYKMGTQAEVIDYCNQNSLATPPQFNADQSVESTSPAMHC
jgi:hypothetical protein